MKITRSLIAMESYNADIVRLGEELSETIDLVKESDDAEYWAAKAQHVITDINRCCHSLWDVMDKVLPGSVDVDVGDCEVSIPGEKSTVETCEICTSNECSPVSGRYNINICSECFNNLCRIGGKNAVTLTNAKIFYKSNSDSFIELTDVLTKNDSSLKERLIKHLSTQITE